MPLSPGGGVAGAVWNNPVHGAAERVSSGSVSFYRVTTRRVETSNCDTWASSPIWWCSQSHINDAGLLTNQGSPRQHRMTEVKAIEGLKEACATAHRPARPSCCRNGDMKRTLISRCLPSPFTRSPLWNWGFPRQDKRCQDGKAPLNLSS